MKGNRMKPLLQSYFTVFLLISALYSMSISAEPKYGEELHHLVAEFKQNFSKNEKKLKKSRNKAINKIKKDSTLSAKQKTDLIWGASEDYRKKSVQNVARYREPLVNKMIDVSNKSAKSSKLKVSETIGQSLYVKDKKTGKNVLNVEGHGGAAGDKDAGGSAKVMDKLHEISNHYSLRGGERTVNNLDLKEIEFTTNNQGILTHKTDIPGGEAHSVFVKQAANGAETYVSVGMDEKQVGKDAVTVQDHRKKYLKGRYLSDSDLMHPRYAAELQVYGKGTKKTIDSNIISNKEIASAIKSSGLNMTVSEYRQSLTRVKKRSHIDGTGLTKENVSQFRATTDTIMDLAQEKSFKQFDSDIKNSTVKRDAYLKQMENKNLSPKERNKLRDKANYLSEQILDSKIRLKETKNVNTDYQAKHESGKHKSSNTPATKIKKTPTSKVLTKGYNTAGKLGGKSAGMLGYYNIALQFTGYIQRGDAEGAAMSLGGMMYDQAFEHGKMAILTKLVPGFAQAYMAYETAYGTTETLMSVNIPGLDKTGYELSYGVIGKPMETLLDYHNGTSEQERKTIFASMLLDYVKDGNQLPPGETLGSVVNKINQNIDGSKDPFQGLSWLEEGGYTEASAIEDAQDILDEDVSQELTENIISVYGDETPQNTSIDKSELIFSIKQNSITFVKKGDFLELNASIPSFQDGSEGQISWQLFDDKNKPVAELHQVNVVNEGKGNHSALLNWLVPSLKNGTYTVALTHQHIDGTKLISHHKVQLKTSPISLHKVWVSAAPNAKIHDFSVPIGEKLYLYAGLDVNSDKDIKSDFIITDDVTGDIVLSKSRTFKGNEKAGTSYLKANPKHFKAGRRYTFTVKVFPEKLPVQEQSKQFTADASYTLNIQVKTQIESGDEVPFKISAPAVFQKPFRVEIEVTRGTLLVTQTDNLSGEITTFPTDKKEEGRIFYTLTDKNNLKATKHLSLIVLPNTGVVAQKNIDVQRDNLYVTDSTISTGSSVGDAYAQKQALDAVNSQLDNINNAFDNFNQSTETKLNNSGNTGSQGEADSTVVSVSDSKPSRADRDIRSCEEKYKTYKDHLSNGGYYGLGGSFALSADRRYCGMSQVSYSSKDRLGNADKNALASCNYQLEHGIGTGSCSILSHTLKEDIQ